MNVTTNGHAVPNGYREKPLLIKILSLIYLLNPIGNIISSTYGGILTDAGTTLAWFGQTLSAGNPVVWINVILWASAIPLAIGLYQVKLWAWYYFIVHSVAMVFVSFFDINWGISLSFAVPVNFLFLIPVGIFLTKEIRAPYFNPRLKWWEQADRVLHAVQARFDGLQFISFDISEDGIFITPKPNREVTPELTHDMIGRTDTLVLESDVGVIELPAHVVRVSPEPHGKYPAGLGMRFLKPDSANKAKLRALLQEVSKDRGEEHR